ncbi:MAG: hypothetical protein QM730_08335 [Anaerolineales bacterium]
MLSRTLAGVICLILILVSSCTRQDGNLHPATPMPTLHLPIATATTTMGAPTPTETATMQLTPLPSDGINVENLADVKLLHQYWLVVANAAGVDPYEMDISAVAASPDGSLIAVGGCSHQLKSDLRSGSVSCDSGDNQTEAGIPFLIVVDADSEEVISIVPENEPDTTVATLAFTRDGKKVIYGVQPGKFAVWDIASNQIESVLWEGEMTMPRIAVSPDSKWIALKTTDKTQIWSTETNEFVAELPAFYRPVFSADSARIVVYNDDEFVVYETGTWAELFRFANPCDCVYAFSPDLSLFAASERAPSEKAPVVIWDTATGEQLQSLEAGRGFTSALAFTPDGKMLWRAGDRGDLSAWATDDWRLLAENIGTFLPITNLHGFRFVDDGKHYLLYSDQHLGLYGVP